MADIYEQLKNKLYKNSDNKIASFLNANSTNAIIVDVPTERKEKLNMLFINDSHLSFSASST